MSAPEAGPEEAEGGAFAPLPGLRGFGSGAVSGEARRVLGIDPGLGSTGYAVVDFAGNRYRLAAQGVIATEPGGGKGERLGAIYDALAGVIARFAPAEAGMEALFFARNVTSAMGVAEARGVLALCLHRHGIGLWEYLPNAIKLSVTGSARADKKAVREYVRLLLGLEALPKTDHEADAIACAITHIHLNGAEAAARGRRRAAGGGSAEAEAWNTKKN